MESLEAGGWYRAGSWYRVVEERAGTPVEVSRHRSLDEARRRFRARGRTAQWRIQDPSGADVTECAEDPALKLWTH